MGIIGLKIDVDGKIAEKKLSAVIASLDNLAPVYGVIGNALLNRVRLCFKLGIDPWGQPWSRIRWRAAAVKSKPIKKDRQVVGYGQARDKEGRLVLTAKGKAQQRANAAGTPGQPLRDTGRLERSITQRADANGVTVGTNLRQARIHQFGGVIKAKPGKRLAFPGPDGELIFAKRVTIPARPYFPLKRNGAETVVALPPAWAAIATSALKRYLSNAAEKV